MHIEQVEPHVSMIRVKGKDPQCDVTTHHTHIIVPGASTSTQQPPISSQYNILDHLGKTSSYISILDLLKSSPIHQEILTKALHDTHVPTDIDPTQFQALVGHLSTTYQLGFSQNNMPYIESNHNRPLHLEVLVNHHKLKRVLGDNGSSLNLFTLKFIKQVGYNHVDLNNQVVTIKVYENAEHDFEGTICLPLQVGPILQYTTHHVLDLELPYNLLLGHSWIHAMQVIPSTYH